MTTGNGELYSRAMDRTQRYVANIKPEQWGGPTPCTEWSVRDVVNHIVYENLWAGELFQGKTMAEVGDRIEGDLLGDDPIGAYERSVQVAKQAVSAPGAMEVTCHLSFGEFPGSVYAGQLFLDLLIHGWDIAVGTGQDTRLDPELVDACYERAMEGKEEIRASGAFGTEQPVAAAANLQTKLLALLGRQG